MNWKEEMMKKAFDTWLDENLAAWRGNDTASLWLGFQAGYEQCESDNSDTMC